MEAQATGSEFLVNFDSITCEGITATRSNNLLFAVDGGTKKGSAAGPRLPQLLAFDRAALIHAP